MSINRQPDHGRTIGNGVVIAYAVLAATVAGMAMYGVLDAILALGVATAAFLFVFAGDMMIQKRDMEHESPAGGQGESPGPETQPAEAESDTPEPRNQVSVSESAT